MSNTNKTPLEITSANQDLFADLNEKDSEKVRGGEIFKFKNDTNELIEFWVDLGHHSLKPNESKTIASVVGLTNYDTQPKSPGYQGSKTYDVKNNQVVTFKYKINDESKPVIGMYGSGSLV